MEFYIGRPYSFRGFNCWDYVSLIRKENGIKTKKYQPVNIENAFEIITAEMQKLGNGLTQVSTPDDFVIVIGHKYNGKRYSYHCGIYYKGDVMHCDRHLRQVVCETYNDFKSKFEGVKLWR